MKQLIKKTAELFLLGVTLVILYSTLAVALMILVSVIIMILFWAVDGTADNPFLFIPIDIALLALIYWLFKKGFFKKAFEGLRNQLRRNL